MSLYTVSRNFPLVCFATNARDIISGCVLPFNNIASTLLLERDYFMEPSSSCQLQHSDACQSSTNQPVDCPSSKWYQPPIPTNATVDGTIYNPLTTSDIDCTDDSWKNGCLKTYCDRQSDAQLQAGTIMSIPYIISACLSPILGGFVDKFGYRAVISTIAPIVLIIVHLLLGLTNVDPIGPLVGQGLAYCGFAAVVWPSVALVVEEHLVGLGYGICFSIQNLGLAIFPLIIATIYQSSGNEYIPNVEMFFVGLAVFGTLIGFFLNYYDYYYLDSILNIIKKDPKDDEYEEEQKERMIGNPIIANKRSTSRTKSREDDDDEEEEVDLGNNRRSSSELFSSSMIH